MAKCQCCKEEEATWSWQPFGPGKNADTMMLPGSHYRGFPVIKIGYTCKSAIETGDFPVKFTYKEFRYIYQNGKVSEVKPDFWNGGTTDLNGNTATMIMKSTPDGSDLIALVVEQDFVQSFIATPDLIQACQQIVQAFPEYGKLAHEQGIAVAKAQIALDTLKA